MWASLPPDVHDLILQHRAATVVQRGWRQHRRLYAHARRPVWARVRDHIGTAVWRRLIAFGHVRREWRQEPHSWLNATPDVLERIVEETDAGLWGPACAVLSKK